MLCRQCSYLPVGTALRPGPVGPAVILPLAVEQQAQVLDAVPLVPVDRALEPQLQPVLPQPQPLQPQDQPDPPQASPLQPQVQHVQLPEPCVEV